MLRPYTSGSTVPDSLETKFIVLHGVLGVSGYRVERRFLI
jgi:hypothetical protein